MVDFARPMFSLGRTVATPGALDALSDAGQSATKFYDRHVRGDWGDIDPEDVDANERALQNGSRILSVYSTTPGVTLWVITEADRSITTILLPEEY